MFLPLKELCHWCKSWRLHQRVVWKSFPLLEDLSTALQPSRTGYFRCWTPFWETPRKAVDPLDSSTMTQTQCSDHPRIAPETCQHGNLQSLAAWSLPFKMLINSWADEILPLQLKVYHLLEIRTCHVLLMEPTPTENADAKTWWRQTIFTCCQVSVNSISHTLSPDSRRYWHYQLLLD